MRKSLIIGVILFLSLFLACATPVVGQPTNTYEGVAVEISEVEADDILFIANTQLPNTDLLPSDPHIFALYDSESQEAKYVISTEPAQTGTATVRGYELEPEITDSFPSPIILASDVDVDTEGTPVAYDDLLVNQRNYILDHVRIEAPYTQLSFTFDVAEGEITNQRTNGRFLPTTPSETESHVLPIGQQTQWVAQDVASQNNDVEINTDAVESKLALSAPVLTQDTQDTRYWANAEATVDAVVLSNGQRMILHIADVSFKSEATTIEAVSEGRHDRDVVTVEADRVGTKVSSKDSLLAAARCAPDSVAFPVVGCLPVPADSTVDSGVLYGSSTERVYYVGLSNEELSQDIEAVSESARITGRVVGASEIDPQLSGKAIIVYDVEPAGDPSTAVSDELETESNRIEEIIGDQVTNLGAYDIDAASPPAISANNGGASDSEGQTGGVPGEEPEEPSAPPTTNDEETTQPSDPPESTTEGSNTRESVERQSSADQASSREPSTTGDIMMSRLKTLTAGIWSPNAGGIYIIIGATLWTSGAVIKFWSMLYRRFGLGLELDEISMRWFVYGGGLAFGSGAFALGDMAVLLSAIIGMVGFELLVQLVETINELIEGHHEGQK